MEERPEGATRRGAMRAPDEWHEEELNRFRELRAEIQGLQFILESIRKGEALPKTYADYFEQTMDNIAELMADIENGDAVQLLHNVWRQMKACPLLVDPEHGFSAQDQLHHLNMLDAQCRKMVFEVGVLTIPARVSKWLGNARPGYYFPFHSVFEDELPDFEDRVKLLNYLSWSPLVIGEGLVDTANGLIYRYSRRRTNMWGSFLLLVVAFAAAIAIVTGACYLPIDNWPIAPRHMSTFLIGWSAVLAGIVVHIGVGTVKRAQAQGGYPPAIAVGDLLPVINARIGQILLKLLLAVIGLFGLALTAGVGNVTPLNAFLVGYSLDSVVGLFGASIEQQAASQAATLKRQLGTITQQ